MNLVRLYSKYGFVIYDFKNIRSLTMKEFKHYHNIEGAIKDFDKIFLQFTYAETCYDYVKEICSIRDVFGSMFTDMEVCFGKLDKVIGEEHILSETFLLSYKFRI